ncbi:membrane protein [Porphyromonas macacae]|uniref:Membrane protein n=1 Tax=Porphyromonas macacae TaxID=28115 RepID=A0A0A2G876_9PORP|nr:membrane protein [Porphyromonas macacae]KGN74373.1 membrane protein [Porphyromonas macacae]KGN99431.1 membrane protein [Porphyromonas macacae]SUB88760.1 Uncharacterized protein conserved in bacteria [Porphyromonas macacae]
MVSKTKKQKSFLRQLVEAVSFIVIFFAVFGYIGNQMGLPNMLNTIMQTSYRLLMDTVFYIMGITVLSGALGALLVEFHVVDMLEKVLRPMMKPIYNLPGVSALGGILTFLSDNPAIISLAKDRKFCRYFKKYQLVSLTNFGTAFGMGLVVIIFMAGQGFGMGALIGFVGAIAGSIISTRLMQYFTRKKYPELDEDVDLYGLEVEHETEHKENIFLRMLNSLLDGGKTGVDLGLAIIPGVLIISTAVMMITNGPGDDGVFSGQAYEGVGLLPAMADKIDFVFQWLFGFQDSRLIAFPITTLGAVGAALGLVPNFVSQGILDGNAVAVFTAMGMCWSGFLSTHTAMLDSLGYRKLITQAIGAHTIGGLVAGIFAHWLFVFVSMLF